MRIRYIIFVILSSLINFFSWYYVVVFCSVYVSSSVGWIQGGVQGLLIDWLGLSLAIPLVKAVNRVLVRNYPKLRFLIFLEHLFFLMGFVA